MEMYHLFLRITLTGANGYQYPHSVAVGKYLWVIYSVNKEDIEVARIPVAELESI